MNRDDLRTLAEAARDAIAAHAALNEDEPAERRAYARMEEAVEAMREALTPDVVLALLGVTTDGTVDPAARRAKALTALEQDVRDADVLGAPYVDVSVNDLTTLITAHAELVRECTAQREWLDNATEAHAALLSERDALVAERLEWMQAFGAISRAVAAGDGESDNTPWPDVVARIEGLGRAWVDALRQSVGEASRANTAEAERDALAARVATLRAWMAEYPNDKYTGAWWLAEFDRICAAPPTPEGQK